MRSPVAALLAVLAAAAVPSAQRFDVVSVKANRSGETRTGYQTPPGRLQATNVPLRFLIRNAYRIPEPRIVGGPDWIGTDRFDVVATTSMEGLTADSRRQMLRALLAERFRLTAHTETRELPIYSLLLVRSNGTLGPNLKASSTVCAPGASRMAGARVECGLLVSQSPASASLRGGGIPFGDFVRMLGDYLDRPVVDGTGLTGAFDLELQFTADRGAVPGSAAPGGLTAARSPDEIPSIFTAVQEQLGLRLEATKGPAEVLVIDRVERPTPD